ncbi:uncharacterized protein RMCC_1796 [Mycolicibacterium canariasense]|uniref:Uncharacterized protein n=1 Tax=Mycolicibacterium canariasense TaxID=228230 RepID=A0A117I9H4_MYCCR|nr:uncharacterized protein RMCC_1796 [Mycolicibacterium canariasense]
MTTSSDHPVRDDAYYAQFSRAVENHEYTVGELEWGPAAGEVGVPSGCPVWVPGEVAARLRLRAEREGVSLEQALQDALDRYLAN